MAPPTRLYWRCAAAERAQSPDGVASDITHSPPSLTLRCFPRGNRQLSAKKSNHDFSGGKTTDQTSPVSPARPAMPINQSGFQRDQNAAAAVATVMTAATQL